MEENGNIIIYQTEDGLTKLDVQLHDETVWLSQQQMAELFHSSRTNIVEHIKHIYQEGELLEISTCRNSDRFNKRVIEWLAERSLFIILI